MLPAPNDSNVALRATLSCKKKTFPRERLFFLRNTEIPEYRKGGIPKSHNTEKPEYRNTGMPTHKTASPLMHASTDLHCTQSRGRTGTGVNLLVFETSASTDSAIWARLVFQAFSSVAEDYHRKSGCKSTAFF